MELIPIYIFLFVFIAIIVIIVILIDKKFLRFYSVKDFARLDEYIHRVEEGDLHPDTIDQYTAIYKYNDKFIRLHAVIFRSELCAARYFNRHRASTGFVMYAATSFVISKNKKTNLRLYHKTFLLVEGERSPDFNEFYKLVLACLKTKA